MLFDDSLPLRSGVVDGEDRRASAVSQRISQGMAPVDAVRAAGVRYVAAEPGRGWVDQTGVRASGRVVVDRPDLLVVEVDDGAAGRTPDGSWNVVGWAVTLLTTALLVLSAARKRKSRRLLASLLRSPP